jgi:hypothetical protein
MFFGQFVNPGNNRWQHLTSLLGHRKAFEPFDHGFGGLELIAIAQTADGGLTDSFDRGGVIGHVV